MMEIIFLVATFAVGMGVVAYPIYAAQNGWPRGNQYSSHATTVQILGFFAWISASILGFLAWGTWGVIIVSLAGFVGAFIMVSIMKKSFQYVGLLASPMAIFAAVYWESV
jgi:hypothetical protein